MPIQTNGEEGVWSRKTFKAFHGMAKYRKGKDAKYADTLSTDEDDDGVRGAEEGLSISATTFVAGGRQSAFPGGPFSALTPSMCPHDAAALTADDHCDYRWDEFGFRVEVEDGPEESSSKILSVPFVEDPQHRLRWIAHLEFTHNQVVEDLTWDKVEPLLPRSEKLQSMVRAGVPHSLRPFIWPRLCGAILKRKQANFTYKDAVKAAAQKERPQVAKQIEKDLLRTMPTNVCYVNLQSTGIPRLRRILRAIAYLYPDIGYCQGTGVIIGSLLLFLEEEDVFWMMCTLIEDLLPSSYFSGALLGLQADQRVLRQLVASYLPECDRVLRDQDIELSLISLHWFLTLFASVLHMKILVRLWDIVFYEGTCALFQATLAMLKLKESELRSLSIASGSSAEIFNLLSELPASIEDSDYLLDTAQKVAPSVSNALIATLRKKQLALLLADQGMLVNPDAADTNLPKQRVHRRRLRRSKSLVQQIFQPGLGSSAADSNQSQFEGSDDPKLKNVHQTELMIDLKEAILHVARHFIAIDPVAHQNVTLQVDYSPDSHARDHEYFVCGRRQGHKRARALLDFERQEEDELGFRKNDVITILCQRDEHCWVGELNGLRGWFPAKFVQVLDERGKNYSALGDDAVTETVTDLVRGDLCSALKAVLQHGMKRSSVIGGGCHPWLFIDEVATKEVKRDFQSVHSRLTLCNTFSLDEDGKVLTPEELLYRAVQRINATHDAARAQMDVKLRSLVCIGLNEQALHLWFELLCCCAGQDLVRSKWYHPWSFVRSPAWVQIKCELRLLAQFSFNLSPDWEIPMSQIAKTAPVVALLSSRTKVSHSEQDAVMDKPLKEGVRDMLVKHHLFSWDL